MYPPTPPANPDIKRELKKQLLGMSARSFEFFAGDFLVYIGLAGVSVTRYFGDGGIDAQGDLIAGMFRIPTGIQVKRYRNNVQRPDIEKFIGALSGRFSQGMFMTTANYAPSALQKASTSIPRILTLNGECFTESLNFYTSYTDIERRSDSLSDDRTSVGIKNLIILLSETGHRS